MICLKNSKNDGNNSNNTQEIILNGLKFGLRGAEIARMAGVCYGTINYWKKKFKGSGQLSQADLDAGKKKRKKIVSLVKKGIDTSKISSSLSVPVDVVEIIEEHYIFKLDNRGVFEGIEETKPTKAISHETGSSEINEDGIQLNKKEIWETYFSKINEVLNSRTEISRSLKDFMCYTKELVKNGDLNPDELIAAQNIIVKAMGRTRSSNLRIQAYRVLLALTIKLRRPNQALTYCNKAINEVDIPKKEKAKFADMSQQLRKAIKMKRIMRQQQYCPSDVIALLAREEGLPEIEVREALRKYGNDMGKALEEIELEL